MSEELSREELIEWANSGLKGILHYIEIRDPPLKRGAIKEAKQAYKQIEQIIKGYPYLKEKEEK